MIPNISVLNESINTLTYPSNTYKIKFKTDAVDPKNRNIMINTLGVDSSEENSDRIDGYVDGIDSIIQSIYLILSTERYQFIIYSWDYGVELIDLYGQPMSYVMAELPRRIREALVMDDRISNVTNFEFTVNKRALLVKFTVITTIGNISMSMGVNV